MVRKPFRAAAALIFAAVFLLAAVPQTAEGMGMGFPGRFFGEKEKNSTYVAISHPDASGEREEAGAKLHLEDIRGKVLESWESGGKPAEIIGELEPGKPYRAVEEEPAPGKAPRPPVDFTVPQEGTIEVTLPVPGTGGNSGRPEREEEERTEKETETARELRENPEMQEQAFRAEPEQSFRIGFITVEYGKNLSGRGRIRIGRHLPGTGEWVFSGAFLATGDRFPAGFLRVGMVLCAALFFASGYLLTGHALEEKALSGKWETLREEAFGGIGGEAAARDPAGRKTTGPEPAECVPAERKPEEYPGFPLPDEERLRAINKDYAFWIRIPGTPVDYPVVRSSDNEEYLGKAFTGEPSEEGTLFLDVFSSPDNRIIHGHNRKSGAMFGSLSLYLDDGFLEKYGLIWVFREGKWEKYQILEACVCPWGDEEAYRANGGRSRLILSTCSGARKLLLFAESR